MCRRAGEYTHDIKRAIACQLLGGSRKVSSIDDRFARETARRA